MKANELRVGNLLSFNNMITKEEIVKVNAWFLRLLVHNPNVENPQLTGYYQPIPITEEWLINFGAYCHESNTNWLYIDIDKLNMKIFYSFDFEGGCALVGDHEEIILDKIKYVHQLQNLYFALTGEELTLKK